MAPILSVQNLTKCFGSKTAVSDVSFSLHEGEITALLGLNGAGKSTILSLLSGRLLADAGEILYRGTRLSLTSSTPNTLGYVPEGAPLFEDLSVDAQLRTLAGLYGLKGSSVTDALDHVTTRFDLTDVRRRHISSLSKGYKRRVALAGAFLCDPELLFLDEPTDGLDPIQKDRMLARLRDESRRHTLLISTHSLEDVSVLCDRVLILSNGRLVFDGSVSALKEQGGSDGLGGAFRALAGKESA